MKPRARRITIGAAALVAVIVAVLVVANKGTVRDHVEAWHIQVTTETERLTPPRNGDVLFGPAPGLQVLSSHAERSVICKAGGVDVGIWQANPKVTLGEMLGLIREQGFRVLEQRFPRRAYILIRDADPIDGRDPDWRRAARGPVPLWLAR